MLTIGSLRRQAMSDVGPHMFVALYPPASFIETPISVGHKPIDGLRYPDNELAKMNCVGCQMARVNAALPDIDSPTTALPVGACALFAASHAGSSCVRKVSHLYVRVPELPVAGWYQSV